MKGEINSNGMLTIKAENELEAYALKQWSETNINESTTNITVSWSPTNFIETQNQPLNISKSLKH